MDNERDEILNDLIKYYENDSTDDLASTVAVPIVNDIPSQTEISGDTVIVKTQQSKPTDVEEADALSTMKVDIPAEHKTALPVDEVLGNLDLNGMPIPQEPIRDTNRLKDIDTPMTDYKQTDKSLKPKARRTGAWYALKPLWISLILCAFVVGAFEFYITDTGFIGTYKRNFTYNMSLILKVFGVDIYDNSEIPIIGGATSVSLSDAFGLSVTAYAQEENSEPNYSIIEKEASTIPFPGADLAKFFSFQNGVVCVKSNYLCFIGKNGKKEWEYTTSISDPILSVNGDYIAIAANNSTQVCLYNEDKLIYSLDAPNKIKDCSVSSKGDVAIVTEKSAYKGAVSVFNKNGEEVFSWVSGVNYITSATVTKNRRVSISLASTENTLTSYVMIFDIYDPEPLNGAEITDSLVYDISSVKNDTLSYSDNAISSIDSDGNLLYSIRFDNMPITHISSDRNGWRAVSYTDNYLPYVNIYDKKGKLRSSVQTESIPDYMAVFKSYIVYNNGRDVICGKASSEKKSKYSAPMSVKNLVMINKNTYMVVYENTLEIIKT